MSWRDAGGAGRRPCSTGSRNAFRLFRTGVALDIGAGVGGPAAYLAQALGVRPLLVEPAMGACRAATRLFGLPAAQADAAALPLGDASVSMAWSLGVLCTMDDQQQMLREVRRVLRPDGVLGMLVFVKTRVALPDQPSGNNFPLDGELVELAAAAGFSIDHTASVPDLPDPPPDWQERSKRIEDELERRFGPEPAWQAAAEQEAKIGTLIGAGDVVGRLLVATPATDR